jgi:hypothetical protein
VSERASERITGITGITGITDITDYLILCTYLFKLLAGWLAASGLPELN